jgi:acylphosphatase
LFPSDHTVSSLTPTRSHVHLHLTIHGRVQGVWYRESARQQAETLGLSGYARNNPTGTVSIEVEGPAEAIAQFVAWCKRGPALAHVSRVEQMEGEPQGFQGFVVRR